MILPKLEDSPSLSTRAYQTIREAILSLKFKPGQYVSIQELSDQLGVSRTPVRDALLGLEKDGLVSIVPYKGAYVSNISIQDIEEIMELRILLEGYAAEKAANLLSVDELAQAESILEQSEKAYNAGKYMDAALIGHQLHELLLAKVQNSRFTKILERLDTHYERIRYHPAILSGTRLDQSIGQHREILEALKLGDAERVKTAMINHLGSVRDDVLSSLAMLSENGQGEASVTPIS